MTTPVQERVRREVEDLHRFFVGWFRGDLPASDFEPQFLARFSPDLVFVPPAGRLLGLQDLASMVRDGYASNPDFAVQIRNVTIRRELAGHALLTYEEWQRNALASRPANNGRLATALFTTGEPLRWLHIHETWLPAEVMAADGYDF